MPLYHNKAQELYTVCAVWVLLSCLLTPGDLPKCFRATALVLCPHANETTLKYMSEYDISMHQEDLV